MTLHELNLSQRRYHERTYNEQGYRNGESPMPPNPFGNKAHHGNATSM